MFESRMNPTADTDQQTVTHIIIMIFLTIAGEAVAKTETTQSDTAEDFPILWTTRHTVLKKSTPISEE